MNTMDKFNRLSVRYTILELILDIIGLMLLTLGIATLMITGVIILLTSFLSIGAKKFSTWIKKKYM